jgi:hypothetical protein
VADVLKEGKVLWRGGFMGISPISNLNQLPPSRSVEGKLEPLPMERIDHTARSDDEDYSPSGGRTARGSEDDSAEENEELEAEVDVGTAGREQHVGVSFFA